MDQFVFVLSYVDDCVYWYTNEDIGKWFMDTLGKRFHVNFLGYAHWFMSIRISQMKDHFISVDQARYTTSFVAQEYQTEPHMYTNIHSNQHKIRQNNFCSIWCILIIYRHLIL